MVLTELFNPAVEAHDMFDATDKDIFEAVMEVEQVHGANINDEPVEVSRTHSEALQATHAFVMQSMGCRFKLVPASYVDLHQSRYSLITDTSDVKRKGIAFEGVDCVIFRIARQGWNPVKQRAKLPRDSLRKRDFVWYRI
ncbi:hypothetical protein EDC04DRAFT_3087724 [Pisolithus marmoratus]|nr:hypothetical protein EDC04DRAFT_3087724 [Pisolithus marmoratus]